MVKLGIGDIAPDFTLPSTGGDIRLSEALGKTEKGVIVYFYPKVMTLGCATEAYDFRDGLNPLKNVGYSIVGVSPDSLGSLEKFARHDALNFPLISNPERDVVETYGASGEKKNYEKVVRGVIRSAFVVGKGGKILLANCNVKAKGHVARLHKELGIDWPFFPRMTGNGTTDGRLAPRHPKRTAVCGAFAAGLRHRWKRRRRWIGRCVLKTVIAGGSASR